MNLFARVFTPTPVARSISRETATLISKNSFANLLPARGQFWIIWWTAGVEEETVSKV